MAIRNLRYQGDPILTKKTKEVKEITPKIKQLIGDMLDTMYENNGVGLAAPQVGILKRVVVIDVGNGRIELINPEIIETEGEQDGAEGCLSFPGLFGNVKRPYKVKVKAQDRNGRKFIVEGEELLARAFCHECDHLDGHVFTELVTEYLKN